MHFIVFANVLHDLHIINTVEYMIQCMGVSLLGILQLQWGGGHYFVLFSMLIMFGCGGRCARWFS